MPPALKRSHVRRSNVTACARCKARKQRCDQNIPACANCEHAGVECVGHDIDGSVVPRSYLKSLENHVAHLEQELQTYRSNSDSNPPKTALNSDNIERALAQASLVSLHSSSFPSPRYLGTGSGLPLLRLVIVGLGAQTLQKDPMTPEASQASLSDLLLHETAAELPCSDVCLRLIDVYLEHSDFFSPILYRTSVLAILGVARDLSKFKERFMIFMILAIAVQLLNRTDSSFPVSKADAFFSAASHILSAHCTDFLVGNLEHLEILLLMIQYSSFSTNPTGTWHMIGLATRIAVDLGLHDEGSHRDSLDSLALDRRRRLFWATYTFERNLCSVLGRPVSVPDEAISVSLPTVNDEYVMNGGTLPQSGPSRLALAVHLIKFRQFESEIMQVLHQKPQPVLKAFDYRSWREDMRQRLSEWRATVPLHQNPTQLAPMEIFDGCVYNLLLQLFLPSRHMPVLSAEELGFLADCATKSIEAYRVCFRDGKLRFYWRTVHGLFRSGVTLIYCINRWPQGVDPGFSAIHASIITCSSVLWGMVERYPAGRPCRDIFESLYQSARQSNREQFHHYQTPRDTFVDAFDLTPTNYDVPEDLSGLLSEDYLLQNVGMPQLFSSDL